MALFRKKAPELTLESLPREAYPAHIGFIMDGNGRWAKKRGLPRRMGHVSGAQTFRKIVKACEARGIQSATFYAFSTENWKRPQEEVDAIMDLLRDYLKESLKDFKGENIRTKFIGDRSALAPDIVALMEEAEAETAHKTGLTLNIALNYGGRHELVGAIRMLAEQVKDGTLLAEQIDEQRVSDTLDTVGQPDPDLIIRPSGEYRTSNFLLWQSAYAEYVFMDVLWPDFSAEHLDRAILEYARRHRRFGGV
ncbi:MAG: isoprenyl transferase [Clostridia bacterium]|nr:isoprenyl transferase [Clostridia bacterium]